MGGGFFVPYAKKTEDDPKQANLVTFGHPPSGKPEFPPIEGGSGIVGIFLSQGEQGQWGRRITNLTCHSHESGNLRDNPVKQKARCPLSRA